ncbi:M48 family metalloprotease [Apilactobacillus xinyiensis]|uniref:M48 family metalloprotease n=1 Tax=Apilactobacillus xinyiensis TaxID=2841032 RepID=A0ABT0HZD4_9LACO|nr:M48 family metalloprotease [Apilactobacillus xinyiensis]MCK8623940.1 M48 family metalloprotease [Apilactobacillus xinyiensis]MCL0318322.1 M48 family metalloprotease [Apilactobacillus xinyiensis]
MKSNWFEQQRSNKHRTIVLLGLFLLLVTAVGAAFGYAFSMMVRSGGNNTTVYGALIGLIVSGFYALIMYSGLSMQSVMSANGARPLKTNEIPMLEHIVTELCLAARIPEPALYIVEVDECNAFATGIKPEKAGLAVTAGLLNALNREQLATVIGHEVAHIKNGDMKVTTLASAFGGAINFMGGIATNLADYALIFGNGQDDDDRDSGSVVQLIFWILTYVISAIGNLLANVLTFAISRNREYLADASSAELTKDPVALAQALAIISGNPVDGRKIKQTASIGDIVAPKHAGIFDTHPSISDRIDRLNAM